MHHSLTRMGQNPLYRHKLSRTGRRSRIRFTRWAEFASLGWGRPNSQHPAGPVCFHPSGPNRVTSGSRVGRDEIRIPTGPSQSPVLGWADFQSRVGRAMLRIAGVPSQAPGPGRAELWRHFLDLSDRSRNGCFGRIVNRVAPGRAMIAA